MNILQIPKNVGLSFQDIYQRDTPRGHTPYTTNIHSTTPKPENPKDKIIRCNHNPPFRLD
jgi:hypothetical protein